jgi:hypothetical protein
MKTKEDDKRVCLNISLTEAEMAEIRDAAARERDAGGRSPKASTYARGVLLAVARGER